MKRLMVLALILMFAPVAWGTNVNDDMNFKTTTTETATITTATVTTASVGALTVTGSATLSGVTVSNLLITSETVTATNVITASECGKDFYLNSATEFVSTLPALSTVSAGCRFRFIVNAAPSGADYTVITGNSLENQIYGLVEVNGAAVAGADEDTITFANGAAVKGDWAEVRSDGTSWYVSGQGVGAGAITLTAAD